MPGPIVDSEEFQRQLSSTLAGQIMLEALERLPEGLAIFDEGFVPLFTNRVSSERFGETYSRTASGEPFDAVIRDVVRKIKPDYDDAQLGETVSTILAAYQKGTSLELRSENDLIVMVNYQKLSDGRMVAASTDVTMLKERERQLMVARKQADAANEAKSAFLANTSHEIRTPLNAILGLAQVLARHDLPVPAREYVDSILDAGRSLTTILNDVLDMSKIEAGKLDIVPVDADLAEVLRGLCRFWRPRAEEKGLDLRLLIDDSLPATLRFDPTRLRQCVSNLLSNAIKFTDRGGIDLMVRMAGSGRLVEIEVRDTGIGICEAALDRLFEPFVQIDGSSTRSHGGSGLGLSITRNLARAMGGGVDVDSTPGIGSVFTLSIEGRPVGTVQSRPDDNDGADPAECAISERLAGLRVLVVDDISVNRLVASLFLRSLGCEITEAVNGRDALDLLAKNRFDVVLLDMHMPVMDGAETIRAIRARASPCREYPVIALTADAMAGDRERMLLMGMDGYLAKPLNESELAAEILRVLADIDANPLPRLAAG